MKGDFSLSASKVKAHSSCPMKVKLGYVDRKQGTKQKSGFLDMGSAVHESIEEILMEYPDERDKRTLEHMFKRRYDEWDPDIEDYLYDRGRECLEVAAKYISKRGDEVEFKGIEDRIEFVLDRDGINEPTTSILDVVTENEIWDWKTGSIRDDTGHDEIIQGSTYLLAHVARYGTFPDKMRFIYLKEGEVRSREPHEDDFEKFVNEAKNLVRSVNSDSFEADPGKNKCHWCEYEYYCPASPVSYSDVDWEEL